MLKLTKAEWDTGFPFRPKTSAFCEVLKLLQAEWDTGFPFRPKKFRKQYPANSRKPPKLARFQRGFFRLTIALWAFSPLERNLIRFAHRGKPEFLSLLPRNCIQLAVKKFFARPLARFLRQLRCSAQSRALARSFASRLVSSKSHPLGGKKRQHSQSVKTYQGGMGYRVPISPQDVSKQYPANLQKRPTLRDSKGAKPL